MLDEIIIEQRLVNLEQAVSDLQSYIEDQPTSENWLEKLIGSISDETAFQEVLEYGRAFRQSDKPDGDRYVLKFWPTGGKMRELRDNLSSEEQEEIMNLSPAYLRQQEEWKLEGKEEGKLEGKKEEQFFLITSLLESRFGTLDAELLGLVEQIAQIPISERAQLLLSLANLSRDELLQRLREN